MVDAGTLFGETNKDMAERTKCTILLYITECTMQQETYYSLAGTYQACCKLVMNNIRWSNIMINCYNEYLGKTFNLQELIQYDILYHYIKILRSKNIHYFINRIFAFVSN